MIFFKAGTIFNLVQFRLSVFLVLCFILGGTSQDIVAPKTWLYLISLPFIAYSLAILNTGSRLWKMKPILVFFSTYLAMHLIYLVPLPPEVWITFPAREIVTEGFKLLEIDLPWLALSLTPEKTLFSLFDFLPPVAVFLGIGTFVTTKELDRAIGTVIIFGCVTVFVGIAQSSGVFEHLYFYSITNYKLPVGFFSNANHQASFLAMIIPFVVGSLSMKLQRIVVGHNDQKLIFVFASLALIVLIAGVLFTRSIAGYLLAFFGFMAMGVIQCLNANIKIRYITLVAIIICLLMLLDFLYLGNYLGEITEKLSSAEFSETSRVIIFSNTIEIAKSFFPFGSGPGSFSDIYKYYEDISKVTVPHAHNDFLEILAELGLLGGIWLLAFFIWWARITWQFIVKYRERKKIEQCAYISALLVIVHSLIDYPLRTISIAVLFILCVCIIVLPD